MNERLGGLAHELRNGLNSAMLALEAIKGGHGSLQGATGAVLTRSLIGLRYVVDCSLADVRLTHQMKVRPESVPVRDLLDDLRIAAAMEAEAKGLVFTIPPATAAWSWTPTGRCSRRRLPIYCRTHSNIPSPRAASR
jgi:signal transduction histidine kinase